MVDPVFNNKENQQLELADGGHVWASRSCGVAGMVIVRDVIKRKFCRVVEYKDYVLLTKRGKSCDDNVGKFCMPCGFLDYDETLYDACRREIWEEAGVDVSDADQWLSNMDTGQPAWVGSNPSVGGQTVSCYFKFTYVIHDGSEFPSTSLEHCLPGEVEEIRWVPVDDAIKMDLAFNHAKVIEWLQLGGINAKERYI